MRGFQIITTTYMRQYDRGAGGAGEGTCAGISGGLAAAVSEYAALMAEVIFGMGGSKLGGPAWSVRLLQREACISAANI